MTVGGLGSNSWTPIDDDDDIYYIYVNEGIHLDLDTWIVPGQIRKANLIIIIIITE